MGPTISATECGTTALSMEFVSKPEEVYRLRTAIPAAIDRALEHVPGLAGCLVLISDKEPRLVTVITFWEGENRARLCSRGAAWIQRVVAPFMDQCLQVRSHDALSPGKALASQGTLERSAQKEDLSICLA